jgi:uncharacterized membrane protein YbhN (UPF0104 family)
VKLIRRLAPWVVGLTLLVVVVTRVPYDALRTSIAQGRHLPLAAVHVLAVSTVLFTDAFATWMGMIALRLRRPFWDVFAVRGATNALFVINYAVGQGAFGYYLFKTGVKPLRATGATLFLIGTNLATLLVLTTITWVVGNRSGLNAGVTEMLAITCASFALYLVVVSIAPSFLARSEVLAPLFVAGLRGHGFAMLGRVPHVIVIVLVQWVALRAWGIEVPFIAGVALTPIIILATVLPISPGGLGTAQAAFAYFFSGFVIGATETERVGKLVAFGIVHFAFGIVAALLVGLICLPVARRRGALRSEL